MRWDRVSLIPQSAMNALNPVYRVGDQIVEAIQLHEPGTSEVDARDRARDLLERVGVDPGRADDYAHELSGGMRQRAVIAMAMACEPDLVIADEPTTALDVIVQDRVLDALTALQAEFGVAMLVISHDVHVIAETCDRVGVMYGGRLMEAGTATEVFEAPTNPYTLGLLNAVPRADADRDADLVQIPGTSPPLLDPPDECVFADRCPFAVEACTDGHPPTYDVAAGVDGSLTEATDDRHRSACYRLPDVDELRAAAGEDETWR
jgi:oligopeptide/dipeptide ABC transporter ATP-binding protein